MNRLEIINVYRQADFDAAVEALRAAGYAIVVRPEYCIETDAPLAVVKKIVMGINWILYVGHAENAPDTQGQVSNV